MTEHNKETRSSHTAPSSKLNPKDSFWMTGGAQEHLAPNQQELFVDRETCCVSHGHLVAESSRVSLTDGAKPAVKTLEHK
ncbi:hypothetical protein GDO78_014787 [Eleutherodactylus coqui]|uniref:Uncharacterized protein n=1 Tax=Eleutherodactylus coqui TaxID=57060 RepID=A0A8J6EEG8_ELECQ|nr:hypothetical protein GDO78_014787 [Eleutherodactylus coqui]